MSNALTTLQTLIQGRKLISDPERWVQGIYAAHRPAPHAQPRSLPLTGPKGETASWLFPQANCFCSVGAGLHVTGAAHPTIRHARWVRLLDRAAYKDTDHKSIIAANDNMDHSQVLAIWDDAIQRAMLRPSIICEEAADLLRRREGVPLLCLTLDRVARRFVDSEHPPKDEVELLDQVMLIRTRVREAIYPNGVVEGWLKKQGIDPYAEGVTAADRTDYRVRWADRLSEEYWSVGA